MKRPIAAEGCTYVFWNVCALCVALVAPMKWVAPFGAALCASSSAENKAGYVFFGTAVGCLLGDGGLGGLMASVMALLGGSLAARSPADRDAHLAAWAFFCCATVGVMRYAHSGVYLLTSALISSLLAIPVAPVWRGLFSGSLLPLAGGRSIGTLFSKAALKEMFSGFTGSEKAERSGTSFSLRALKGLSSPAARENLTGDERMALHLLACTVIAGILRAQTETGLFFAGFFALVLAGEGVSAGALGAFTAGMSLLLGNADAVPAALLLIGAGASGLGRDIGRWAQSLLFLTGLLLTAYFGWDRTYGFLFGAAVVYPWIPEAFLAPFRHAFIAGKREEAPNFHLSVARRQRPAEGQAVSGDTGAAVRLPGGRTLILLADGMGTGEGARRLSLLTVREALHILRAPIHEMTAFRAINRLSDAGGNAFSTLDACVIDLYSGNTRFYKCGSENSWVIQGKKVLRVCASSLPLGTLPEAPPSVTNVRLRPGDTVILATDGLVAALGGEEATEKAIRTLIGRSPAEIVSRLMKTAKSRAGARPDDQSVICARLCPRKRMENTRTAANENEADILEEIPPVSAKNGSADAKRAS